MTISILSIFNFNIMKFISGIISITIGFIYYNPFKQINKINELISQNIFINLLNIYNLDPSKDLIIFISVGIAMIYQSIQNVNIFYYICCCCALDDCDNKRKRKGKIKRKCKCKINCGFEFDEKKSDNDNNSIETLN